MKLIQTADKLKYLDLLLIADEQIDMIRKYIHRGKMYILEDDGIKGECVVTDENFGILEIKNLAVYPRFQNQGYGRKIIDMIAEKYRGQYKFLQVGTGDSLLTIPFYFKCGFEFSHRVKNFFVDNYDHEIYECGIKLVDMIILKKIL